MITSLHSPHVERVKALLGSRGVKERNERGLYVIEGLQNLTEAMRCETETIETIYVSESADEKFQKLPITGAEVILVSDPVMNSMSDTVTPQGVLAVAKIQKRDFSAWLQNSKDRKRIAYFWQIQDPGNAGTVIRAADAFGFDAVVFSENSVDAFSPKVVRSTAGSFWHVPVFEGSPLQSTIALAAENKVAIYATVAQGRESLEKVVNECADGSSLWIFGNEARGLPDELRGDNRIHEVSIPMSGRAESLNLASAASVVMFMAGSSRGATGN